MASPGGAIALSTGWLCLGYQDFKPPAYFSRDVGNSNSTCVLPYGTWTTGGGGGALSRGVGGAEALLQWRRIRE